MHNLDKEYNTPFPNSIYGAGTNVELDQLRSTQITHLELSEKWFCKPKLFDFTKVTVV